MCVSVCFIVGLSVFRRQFSFLRISWWWIKRLKTQKHTAITLTCVCDFTPVSCFIVMAHENECWK